MNIQSISDSLYSLRPLVYNFIADKPIPFQITLATGAIGLVAYTVLRCCSRTSDDALKEKTLADLKDTEKRKELIANLGSSVKPEDLIRWVGETPALLHCLWTAVYQNVTLCGQTHADDISEQKLPQLVRYMSEKQIACSSNSPKFWEVIRCDKLISPISRALSDGQISAIVSSSQSKDEESVDNDRITGAVKLAHSLSMTEDRKTKKRKMTLFAPLGAFLNRRKCTAEYHSLGLAFNSVLGPGSLSQASKSRCCCRRRVAM